FLSVYGLIFLYLTLFSFTSLAAPAPSNSLTPRDLPVSKRLSGNHRSNPSLGNSTQTPASETILAFKPWPRSAYAVPLSSSWYLSIQASPYISHEGLPPPTISSIQAFILRFANDIQAAYPPPALSPPEAILTEYDFDSYTEYGIRISKLRMFASLAPSAVVVEAVRKLAAEVRKHGPPTNVDAFIKQERGGMRPARLFNTLKLKIIPLGPDMLDSSADGRAAEFVAAE
ncbi:MAG: hypothetical protein Q9169_007856, partial [Polycauliona sp. 2 TL-2023]